MGKCPSHQAAGAHVAVRARPLLLVVLRGARALEDKLDQLAGRQLDAELVRAAVDPGRELAGRPARTLQPERGRRRRRGRSGGGGCRRRRRRRRRRGRLRTGSGSAAAHPTPVTLLLDAAARVRGKNGASGAAQLHTDQIRVAVGQAVQAEVVGFAVERVGIRKAAHVRTLERGGRRWWRRRYGRGRRGRWRDAGRLLAARVQGRRHAHGAGRRKDGGRRAGELERRQRAEAVAHAQHVRFAAGSVRARKAALVRALERAGRGGGGGGQCVRCAVGSVGSVGRIRPVHTVGGRGGGGISRR